MRPDSPPAGSRARRLLDVAWRVPFVLAATLMVASGAAHALGRTGVPPLGAVLALGLAAAGTFLGLTALRFTRPSAAGAPHRSSTTRRASRVRRPRKALR